MGLNMTRAEHRRIWRVVAKKRDLPEPNDDWYDYMYGCLGVDGRMASAEEFAADMFDEDGVLSEILFFESEALRN